MVWLIPRVFIVYLKFDLCCLMFDLYSTACSRLFSIILDRCLPVQDLRSSMLTLQLTVTPVDPDSVS